MHILYLHQYFVPPSQAGGTRSYEMARRWVAWGHRVTIVTSSARYPVGPAGGAVRDELDGIELVVLPVAYSGSMTYAQRMRAFASFALRASRWAITAGADVVFASSTPLTIAVPGMLGALFGGVPMVFEVRDSWPELPVAMGALTNPVAIWGARALETVACRAAAEVIALSPGMADGVARCGVSRSKIHVVPNACDVDAFDVDADEARAFVRRNVPGQGPLVVYAGSFGAINDAAWLVDVAALNPRIRFVFIGDGPGRSAIESRARSCGLLNRSVFSLPPVAKRDIPYLLRGARLATSLFLPIPAMENNSANKFFDALAAGVPVAINYGGWQADLLRSSGAGLVMPRHDLAAAASMVRSAVTDDEWQARSRQAALRLARGRFDRDALARQALDVVERVAAG